MAEPVTLAEAKAQCRIDADDTDSDPLITALIIAAREWVENFTGLILVERELTQGFDAFSTDLVLYGWPVASDSTVSVTYLDSDGEEQTVADTRLRAASRPARVWPAYGVVWPSIDTISAAVTVTYTAGYATADDVPQSLKQAMLLLIGHWFARREAAVVGQPAQDLPLAVEALARPYRAVVC